MIIAIDGPSSAGKSTFGKLLAKTLGLLYLDTGAMYRAVGFAVIKSGIKETNDEEIIHIAKNLEIELTGEPDTLRVLLNGKDISNEIRTNEIGQMASIVSTLSAVRKNLVERQRILGEASKHGAVLDGRDIGTVVFPNADIKFFLTANAEARAQRRHQEDTQNRRETNYENTLKEINERDERDINRKDSPLRNADDAIVIDTSEMNEKEVFSKMLAEVKRYERAK